MQADVIFILGFKITNIKKMSFREFLITLSIFFACISYAGKLQAFQLNKQKY